MNTLIQNGANISTIITGLLALLSLTVGGLWRVAQGLSKHDSRLSFLETEQKKSEAEQAEILRAARENAERLTRIETDVRWLRETFRDAIGGQEKR